MATVAYGYRVGEGGPDLIPKIPDTNEFKAKAAETSNYNPVVAVSSGCHVSNAACPASNQCDGPTVMGGAMKRILVHINKPSIVKLKRIKRFVKRWCHMHLTPLPVDSDLSVEAWLETTSYSRKRKDQLIVVWNELLDRFDPKHPKCNSFIKAETYAEYKQARTINSRSDEFKCLVGPIFKLIEKEVFKSKYFIKKVPVADRPAYIEENVRQEGADVQATDYTSFESSFRKEVMEAIEMVMYKYMTQHLNESSEFGRLLAWITATQYLSFKNVLIEMAAIRMSGEMCTSLGNGFSNLMVYLFLCEEHNIKSPKGVFEGDDGLCSQFGKLKTKWYAELGFVIKLENVEDICSASFCGIIYDEIDRVNVTEPIDVLLNVGWASKHYVGVSRKRHLELLRSKGLSLAHQYPGSPIISSLAKYLLKVTKGITVRVDIVSANMWEKEQLLQCYSNGKEKAVPDLPVGQRTRFLVEKKFGITIEDQLAIEEYLNSLSEVSVLDHTAILHYVNGHAFDYFQNYVRVVNLRDQYSCSHPDLPRDQERLKMSDIISLPQNHGKISVCVPRKA